MTEATKRVILMLKEVKIQKNLSNGDIVELCDKQGDSVSPSTVRRVFAKGSEDGPNFRAYIIDAIFKAVVGTESVQLSAAEKAELTDTGKEIVTENSALKAMIELNDKTIANLQQAIADRNDRISELEHDLSILQVKLDNTMNLFRLAMESLGRGSAK